jgi:hypothetical protein
VNKKAFYSDKLQRASHGDSREGTQASCSNGGEVFRKKYLDVTNIELETLIVPSYVTFNFDQKSSIFKD